MANKRPKTENLVSLKTRTAEEKKAIASKGGKKSVEVKRKARAWKEIANIMNNAIEGWKPHGTHRFGKEYGIQRSWKRIESSGKKDKDGFMEVPEQLEIPFE